MENLEMATDFRLRSFYQNIFPPSVDETYSRQGISEAEKNKKNLLKLSGFFQRYVRFIKAIYMYIYIKPTLLRESE